MKMKRIMGLFLALAVSIGCMSLSPIVSYADDTNTKTFNINERSVNITQSGIYKIEGTGHATSNTISVTGNSITATIILNNVNIDVSNQNQKAAFLAKNNDQSNVHLTIILKGTNSLKSGETCAGLKWNNSNNNSKLEIKGDGSLTAEGGESGAGIGGGNRGSGENITIAGGTVTATGGAAGSVGGGAAGIGGGFSGSGKNITITGGTVIATGGSRAAGIGGGSWGSGKNITITGGTVTAEGGWTVAGIGGGNGGSGENIKITGGSVKANSISATPADGDGNSVYLAKLESQDGVNEVTVDSGTENKKTFTRAGSHPGGDTAFYLYLTGQDHDLVTSKGKYNAEWNSNANRFAIIEFDSANVNSMSVTAPPSKVSYTEGEKLDLSGLVVTLTDDHGKTKEVKPDKFAANGIKATPKNGTKLVLTDNGAKVKLTKDGVPSVETEKLTVNKLNPTSMSVTSQPKKLKYTEGENLDLTGLEVTLEDANHVKKVVTPAQFEANGIKAAPKNGKKLELTDGGKPVTLTKDGLQAVKTSNLAVEELKPTSMSVTSQPTKLKYTEGETLDLTGLVVALKDVKGVTKDVPFADFDKYKITAAPANETPLTVDENNGKPVKLTKDGVPDAETGKLIVYHQSSGSGHGAGSAGGSSAGNGNTVENALEVRRADAAVKQALDRLGDALAWAKRVAADPNATRAQVDAAVLRLVEARKALADAKANAANVRAAVRNRVVRGMRSRGGMSNAGIGNNALSNTVENAPGVKRPQRKPRFKTPAAKPQSKSQSGKRVGVVPKRGGSALYAGLLAVLGFSVVGITVLCRKRMMEGSNE